MTKLTQQEIEKDRVNFESWYKEKCRFSYDFGALVIDDQVKNPKHYQIIDGFESIDIIACSMTEEQFKGFCLGNILKYRIRAGNKDALEQDIAKANEYKSIFESKKHLCRG